MSVLTRRVDIFPALIQDVTALAAIWPVSMRANPVMNFMFPNQIYDSRAPHEYIRLKYEHLFRQPGSYFIKASDEQTGEIVGYLGYRLVEKKRGAWR